MTFLRPKHPSARRPRPAPRGPFASRAALAALLAGLITLPALAHGASLRGSRASVFKQYHIALRHRFTMLRTATQVRKFVRLGLLVPLPGNADYFVKPGVSFPYARPEVKLFVERLARQYHASTGERLEVTSLTRPVRRQPDNASSYSVHPTGMAVDLHCSSRAASRRWLEGVFLQLERRGVIEATREHHPPHYHVAVFPDRYASYVAALQSAPSSVTHQVRRGDTLWTIARRYGSTVDDIQSANDLASPIIHPGQMLTIPSD